MIELDEEILKRRRSICIGVILENRLYDFIKIAIALVKIFRDLRVRFQIKKCVKSGRGNRVWGYQEVLKKFGPG